jgi:predicted CXXCH cytochrome family protein
MHQKTLLQTRRSRWLRLVAVLLVMATGAAAVIASTAPVLATPDFQPKTTHAVEGRENCLMCHPVGSGGALPSPSDHAPYSNATCLGCHPAVAAETAAPATEPAAPAAAPAPATEQTAPAAPAGPSPTTHPVEGREDCQMCHQVEAGVSPMPADHAGFDNANCLMCHPAVPADQAGAAPAPSGPPSCIDCHRNEGLSMEFPSGEKLSLFVDEQEMAQSVHGETLACSDCHTDITGYPHAKVEAKDRREYSMALYEACKRCHFANYTKTLDSMHYKVLEAGNRDAPLCTDCHGYHNVSDPTQPRAKISKSCASCHEETYNTYTESIHGAALVKDENNMDVPVCTDCHGTHVVQDTGAAAFRHDSPEMCADCHADESLMAKYDLSPRVFSTYMQDFHGTTVLFAKKEGSEVGTDKAVCSDCHGVHDIKSFKSGDPAQIRQDILAGCQKCHPDAGTNFPDSWLGHYELSLQSTPLPWLVRAFYTLLIPFMIGGLMLHIAVDLWRIGRNR